MSIRTYTTKGVTVTEDLRKFDKWLKALQKAVDKNVLSVGILQPEASIVYKSGATMGQIAEWNEFGVPRDSGTRIPARPFMRQTFRKKKNIDIAIKGMSVKGSKAMSNPTHIPQVILGAVGKSLAAEMKRTIRAFDKPKNADSTIKKKGKDDPLVESGLMMNSVRYEVKKRGT
jgi:phage gpG-like protein